MTTAWYAQAGAPRTAIFRAWGSFLGTFIVAVLAGTMGAAHDAAWVIAPEALGVACSAAALYLVYRRARDTDAGSFMLWYRSRGLAMTMLSGIPAYVAIVGMSLALSRH